MDEEQRNRIQDKYQQQIAQARQEMGRHPQSGIEPTPSDRCRIGAKMELFHQSPSGQPAVFRHTFHRWLNSSEQPFERHLTVTEEWQPLDSAWIPKNAVGILAIKNTEGQFQVVPTPEEETEVMIRIVQIAHHYYTMPNAEHHYEPLFQIRPRECAILEPVNLEKFAIRCAAGKARCILLITPD